MESRLTTVALADDHKLLRNGLANLVQTFSGFRVLFEADNGKHFLEKINVAGVPDIVLMDINMPLMDGYETTLWLKRNHPEVKVLALSMYDDDQSIIRMLKCGAKGYILKDVDPPEFKHALNSLVTKGFHYSELITGKLIHTVNNLDDTEHSIKRLISLNDRETEFLKLACTEFTYKEIADQMILSPRTIDGYRDDLFDKLKVKTRVGLVMYAIKNGIVNL